MGRLLSILALLAVALASVAALIMNMPTGTETVVGLTVPKAIADIDPASFVAGLCAGVAAYWLWRIPAAAVQAAQLRRELRRSFHWRRRLAFASVLILATAALLLR